MSDLKSRLRAILQRHIGRGEAISADTLAEMFGYRDDRIIRKTIKELIDEGFPVVSVTEPPAGYFIPASISEARKYTKSLQKRAVLIFLRRRKVIRNAGLYFAPARQEKLL